MDHPPLVIPNCVQIRLLQVIGNQGGVNVIHAIKPAGLSVTQALANSVGSAIKSAYTTNMAPVCVAASLRRVGIRDLTTANQPEFLDTGLEAPGTATGDALPPNVSLCVTLRTGQSGKKFTGRIYLGGFAETQNAAGGTAAATATSAAVNFMTAVDTALDGLQLTLAIASRPSFRYETVLTWYDALGIAHQETLSTVAARTAAATPVTIIQSRDSLWESQRRRNNGRGTLPTVFEAEGFAETNHSKQLV